MDAELTAEDKSKALVFWLALVARTRDGERLDVWSDPDFEDMPEPSEYESWAVLNNVD